MPDIHHGACPHAVRGWRSETRLVCAGQRVVQEGSSPSDARMRSVISERGGNASRAGESKEGMEKPKRARRRKPETAKADLQPPCSAVLRRAGCPPRGGIRRA